MEGPMALTVTCTFEKKTFFHLRQDMLCLLDAFYYLILKFVDFQKKKKYKSKFMNLLVCHACLEMSQYI